MKIVYKNLIVCAFALSLFLSSCEYTTIEVDPPVLPPVDEEISYAEYIAPIFAAKCVTCHVSRNPVLTSSAAYNSLINGNYVNTATPASSSLYVKVLGGHPGGGQVTTATENALILRWIQEGAKNN